ncbi:hypothetical protein [Haloferax sp. DFSO60]|uniref:hypothetical protein n=1 Tax=Haloferax sp. DFSO60 TaxID=3388652 RepID=UPI00397AD801
MTEPTFDAYAATRTDARFTDWLRVRTQPNWAEATEHRFVRELTGDTLDDDAFRLSFESMYELWRPIQRTADGGYHGKNCQKRR